MGYAMLVWFFFSKGAADEKADEKNFQKVGNLQVAHSVPSNRRSETGKCMLDV